MTNPTPDETLPAREGTGVPPVGVVMPILNEERHLEEAVAAVLGQDYPGALHLVLALGPSHDRTDEIADRLARADGRVRTVPNPTGRTPEALNAAIAALDDVDVVVRVDGATFRTQADRGFLWRPLTRGRPAPRVLEWSADPVHEPGMPR